MPPVPNELTAVQAALALAEGSLSAERLAATCLDRIAERDPLLHAWTAVDAAGTLAEARRVDAQRATGPLAGLPVGIKDVIDLRGFPTAMGSPIHAGHRPATDASCVALLRKAGAIFPGKTATTELAFVGRNRTANPHNPAHSPGASSAGSAAAVADCMVPLALGTQTASSVTRPAAHCGVAGYKSSLGAFSLAGIKPFAPSFDCLGGLARSVEDLMLLRAGLGEGPYRLGLRPARTLPARIGLCLEPFAGRCEASATEAVEQVASDLRGAGVTVTEVDLPCPLDRLEEAHKSIMAFEAARSYAAEFLQFRGQLSEPLQTLLRQGWECPRKDYLAALAFLARVRRDFAEGSAEIGILLTPSATGEAPPGLETIGDPICSRPWSLLGVPSVTLPAGRGPAGMPIGIQLVGQAGQDDTLLLQAHGIEGLLSDLRRGG